jgi:deoxyribonuclease V
MMTSSFHSWRVSPQEAIQIQEKLRRKICLCPPTGLIKIIAAGDVSYHRREAMSYAAFLLFTYPELAFLESASARGFISFPYIPGLLTFREAPILLKAFSKLKTKPDLILVDGQGVAHPRSMGIAAHLGILLHTPSIGCAKSRLIGTHQALPPERGNVTPLMENEKPVGMVVRTRDHVNPLFVSPGYRMDLESSAKIVLSLCRGYRIPEPLRQAHIFVNQLREKENLKAQKSTLDPGSKTY